MIPTTDHHFRPCAVRSAGCARRTAAQQTLPDATWALLARLWWASLIVIHLPILAAVVRAAFESGLSADRLGSLAALAVTVALFAAKLSNARFLRLRSNRQTIIATCLATAIMHHEVFAAPRQEWVTAPAIVVLAIGAVAGSNSRLRRRARQITRAVLRTLTQFLCTPRPFPWHAGRCGRHWETPIGALSAQPVLCTTGPRGPPRACD